MTIALVTPYNQQELTFAALAVANACLKLGLAAQIYPTAHAKTPLDPYWDQVAEHNMRCANYPAGLSLAELIIWFEPALPQVLMGYGELGVPSAVVHYPLPQSPAIDDVCSAANYVLTSTPCVRRLLRHVRRTQRGVISLPWAFDLPQYDRPLTMKQRILVPILHSDGALVEMSAVLRSCAQVLDGADDATVTFACRRPFIRPWHWSAIRRMQRRYPGRFYCVLDTLPAQYAKLFLGHDAVFYPVIGVNLCYTLHFAVACGLPIFAPELPGITEALPSHALHCAPATPTQKFLRRVVAKRAESHVAAHLLEHLHSPDQSWRVMYSPLEMRRRQAQFQEALGAWLLDTAGVASRLG